MHACEEGDTEYVMYEQDEHLDGGCHEADTGDERMDRHRGDDRASSSLL